MLAKFLVILLLVASSFALNARSAFADAVVPNDLEGQSRLRALVILEAAGFRVTVQEEPSCVTAKGLVSSVNPLSGTIVTADPPRVTLGISVGGVDDKNAVLVPNVVNKTFDQASQALSQVGLEVVDETFFTEGKGKCPEPVGKPKLVDSVVFSTPRADARVCHGTKVSVHREIYQNWVATPKNEQCK